MLHLVGFAPVFVDEERYFLASSCVYCAGGQADFCIRCCQLGQIYAQGVYNSNREYAGVSMGLRPVVTLKSNVKVTKSGDTVSISI